MAKPSPSNGVAQDISEPGICRPELDPDAPLPQNGWKIYDESKAAWVDAWARYYEEKSTADATRWAEYEKNKDYVQRRWRSATESGPFPLKSAKGAPAATKISFNLSVDTDLAAAARQWSKPSTPRPDGTLPKPQADINSPLPRVSTAGRPGLSRAKSTPHGMRSPITPSSGSPFQFSPSPLSSSPKTPSPITRSSPRPILRQNSSSPASSSPQLSRSAPATHSPPRTFWTAHEGMETWKREQDLRQRQADFERQREQMRRASEEQQREKRAAEQAEKEKQTLDDAIAAARRADEEKQRRKIAARISAEREAAEQRRAAAESEWRREEERARREAERLRREEAQRQKTRDAWENYEQRWRNANTQEVDLSFASIPWPMESQPHSQSDITSYAIKDFILSPLHSMNKSHKQRLREQLLRFHPDRFEGRWLSRVRESDRAEVKDAINSVARYLNEALSQSSAWYVFKAFHVSGVWFTQSLL